MNDEGKRGVKKSGRRNAKPLEPDTDDRGTREIINRYKRQRTVILVICILLSVWSLYSIATSRIKHSAISKETAEYKRRMEELTEEKKRLKAEKEMSQSLEYIEKMAREKLKMVKPGEIVYIINENNNVDNSDDPDRKKSEEKTDGNNNQ